MKHENVVLFDNKGLPSIMVKFTPEAGKPLDPMFMIGNKRAKAIYISKYGNTMIKGAPCSIPFMKPTTNMTLDEASELCRSKGPGWHLMTTAEWEYLHNESIEGGTLPHGNTDCGKYFWDKQEAGKCYDYGHTLAGSGPSTWSHTHDETGVYDLCGNNWELTAGSRISKGRIEYIKDNGAAVADISKDSEAWQPAKTAAGEDIFIIPTEDGLQLTVNRPDKLETKWNGCAFKNLEIKLDEVPEILKQLGFIPENIAEEKAYIYADAELEEAVPLRGSSFNGTSDGGVGGLYLLGGRSGAGNDVGFRSAYYELEELETEN